MSRRDGTCARVCAVHDRVRLCARRVCQLHALQDGWQHCRGMLPCDQAHACCSPLLARVLTAVDAFMPSIGRGEKENCSGASVRARCAFLAAIHPLMEHRLCKWRECGHRAGGCGAMTACAQRGCSGAWQSARRRRRRSRSEKKEEEKEEEEAEE